MMSDFRTFERTCCNADQNVHEGFFKLSVASFAGYIWSL